MASVNIGGDALDASYRYKMPKIMVKVEGRGNGIKTAVPNMLEIARALHIDPNYPTKFFGLELGAQSKYDKKRDYAIINGNHNASDLEVLLKRFIDLFVLCPKCRLPELNMDVKRDRIKIDCAACGHNGQIQTNHRLTTFILKNPPPKQKRLGKSKGDAKEKEEEKDVKDAKGKTKKEKKKKKRTKDDSDSDEEEGGEEDKLNENHAKSTENVEWFTDTSKNAQDKRKEVETAEMKALERKKKAYDAVLKANEGLNKDSPVFVLKLFIAEKDRTTNDIVSEIKRLQLSRALDETQKIKLVLQGLIDTSEPSKIGEKFGEHKEVLKNYVTDKATANMFIGCIEEFVVLTEPALRDFFPIILNKLYEDDVLEEDAIISWYESPPESSWLIEKDIAEDLRGKSKIFVDWLKEADEDDEEDDDDVE